MFNTHTFWTLTNITKNILTFLIKNFSHIEIKVYSMKKFKSVYDIF